jgi:2'-5' RNA ligase
VRLFVALVPDEQTKIAIYSKIEEVKRHLPLTLLKYVRPENMHLTLAFLGETEPSQLGLLKAQLDLVRQDCFLYSIKGIGTFPVGSPNPQVVFLSILSHEANALAAQIRLRLERFLKPDFKPFVSHLTLARSKAKIQTAELAVLSQKFNGFNLVCKAEEFLLMESRLTAQGSSYQISACYPLKKPF